MALYTSKKASEGNFSGKVGLQISPELHRALYKEAQSKNVSVSGLVGNIIRNRTLINRRQIWTSDEFIKRSNYTIIFFKNNINSDEVCVQLYGVYQEHEDISDSDHMFSNFINNRLEFASQKLLCCEFIKDDNGVKELKLSDWYKI